MIIYYVAILHVPLWCPCLSPDSRFFCASTISSGDNISSPTISRNRNFFNNKFLRSVIVKKFLKFIQIHSYKVTKIHVTHCTELRSVYFSESFLRNGFSLHKLISRGNMKDAMFVTYYMYNQIRFIANFPVHISKGVQSIGY